jgi:hypothetical protein
VGIETAGKSANEILPYLSVMKPIITVEESEFKKNEMLKLKLESLGKLKVEAGLIEYMPKSKKATEVIRLLRENRVEYQILFDHSRA